MKAWTGAWTHGNPASVRAAVRLCACVSLLSGCAYYNGMYNTRRFARNAERSERAGRTSEAADRWRQVVLHADTLLARHPGSRWADDAELLKGRALVALRAWPAATEVLERAKSRAGTEEQRRDAQYWLGIAAAGRRDHGRALANLDSALASARRERRQAARLARGRLLLAMGRPAEALRDFDAVAGDAVRFERATAALALALPAAAAAHADSAVGAADVAVERWIAFLDTLGRRGGTLEASALVGRLVSSRQFPAAARTRMLLEDGDRLASAGLDAPALERWEAVMHLDPDGDTGRLAEVRTLRLALRMPDAASRLDAVRYQLESVAGTGGEAGQEARDVLRILAMVGAAPRGTVADAHAYRVAELLRDSIPSPPLAAAAFAAMAGTWPESPWAPKAILAAIGAAHPAEDSLRLVLAERYAHSPYTLAAAGAAADPDAFAAIEDSLAFSLETVGAVHEPGAAPGRGEPVEEELLRERGAAGVRRPRATPAPPPAAVRAAPPRTPTLPRDPQP
jgi:tetratricopeptide (TPR) repeat protein